MKIGIDGSRAFLEQRTGIEEYSYQTIKNLRNKLNGCEVVLYLKKNQKIDFDLPKNWKAKKINWTIFWTQIGLSWELFFHPVDILFISAHILPAICPSNSVLVVHGLEYEKVPEAYSFPARLYMRFFIKNSCRRAKKIIAVSKNTKKDLIEIYKIPGRKIEVIYEGVNPMRIYESHANLRKIPNTRYQIPDTKYLLFVGRLEKRKNIEGIISAFEMLKKEHKIPHKLILAGRPGFGYRDIKDRIFFSHCRDEIIKTGFISQENKIELIKSAEIFLFPSFYEGFGLPVLEAQNMGVPVVTSNNSSLPEVGMDSLAYCTPAEPASIADAVYKIISDQNLRESLIKKGYENVKRFSWEKCASEIAKIFRICHL